MSRLINPDRKVLILDGGLGSELENQGANVGSSHLWSAEFLVSNPDILKSIHRQFITAGADVVTTASYQASVPGFAKYFAQKNITGTEEELRQLAINYMALSVKVAQEACDEFWAGIDQKASRQKPLVAASIGPYGAYLANGEEYTGAYGFENDDIGEKTLRTFHEPRLTALLSANPDIIAIETIPTYLEVKVLFDLLLSSPTHPTVWLAFSVDTTTCAALADGTPFSKVFDLIAQYSDGKLPISAFGVNCLPPHKVGLALQEISEQLQSHGFPADFPLVVYPNSGEIYNGITKEWAQNPELANDKHTEKHLCFGEFLEEWYGTGARLIGGCCRTNPGDIAQIRSQLEQISKN